MRMEERMSRKEDTGCGRNERYEGSRESEEGRKDARGGSEEDAEDNEIMKIRKEGKMGAEKVRKEESISRKGGV
jgi:hypothetical protein